MRAHVSEWSDWERRCASEACSILVPTSPATDQPTFATQLTDEPDTGSSENVHQQQALTKLQRLARRSSTLLMGSSYHAPQQQLNPSATVSESLEASGSNTTLTLRRRHSASASTLSLGGSGGIAASESGASIRALKHTKSEPKKRESIASLAARMGAAKSEHELTVSASTKRLSRTLPSAISVVSCVGGAKEKERQNVMKLTLADYLIKPVQRICKYPLLLEQLRGPVPTEDETDFAIAYALRSMKDVALAVDEARRRRDVEIKSKLIVDRLVAGNPSSGSSSHLNNGGDAPITRNNTFGSDVEMENPSMPTTRSQSSLKAQPSRALSLSSAFTRSRSRVNVSQQAQQTEPSHVRSKSWQQSQSQSQQNLGDLQQSGSPNGGGFVPGAPSRAFLTSLGACLLAGTLDVTVAEQESASSKSRRDSRRDSTFSTSSARSLRGGRTSPLVSTMRVQEVDELLDDAGSAFVQAPPAPVPQQQSNRDPVKVKYLVAFLYVGGYMVMAKPVKAGVYAARHWFSLTEDLVDVVDLGDDEALLPCSLQLFFRSTGHRLELAAACQREKQLWLDAIQSARSVKSTWEYEPLPTLSLSTTFVSSRTRTSIDLQPPPPVPAIPAVPSVSTFAAEDDEHRLARPSRKHSSSTVRTEATVKQQRQPPNKRASVTGTSVRSFFLNNGPLAYGLSEANSTGPSTVLLRRASATRRAQADRLLADVLSEPLLEARIHAKAHDEVLFRDPEPPQNSTLGMSTIAKNKLMNRESILVSKQCTPLPITFAFPEEPRPVVVPEAQSELQLHRRPSIMSRALSIGRRRATPKRKQVMQLTLATSKPELLPDEGAYSQSSSLCSPVSPDSPLPGASHFPEPLSLSQCSSVSTHAAGPSPFDPHFPPEVRVVGIDSPPHYAAELPDILEQDTRPKRSRSLVDNVKGFFIPRSTSPSPSPSSSSSRQTSAEGLVAPQRSSILTRVFRSNSNFHRQVNSSDPSGDDNRTPRRLQLVHSSTASSYASSSLHPDSALSQEIPLKNRADAANLLTPMSAEFVHISPSDVPDATTSSSSSSASGEQRDKRKSIGRNIKRRFFSSTLTPLTPVPLQHAI
ncbi:hypothetical protein SCHPADRAFT_242850 [Schizopora paradoxa]|uniref:DH domain-containing protein n=1 Tax=Schizopora paradoxa TaxID=27342 RepID=A0A0H2RVT2_9AGAM|nr:hypothetical protein SCHPADRAFT_242850 [Schizopora paradoxa]